MNEEDQGDSSGNSNVVKFDPARRSSAKSGTSLILPASVDSEKPPEVVVAACLCGSTCFNMMAGGVVRCSHCPRLYGAMRWTFAENL